MNELTITFNNQTYIAKYNPQTGYYEVEITAPETGGIYNADIAFSDIFEVDYEADLAVQILAKEPIKIESNKVFMWIFDYKDFAVKDIVEIAEYDINVDEETNANTILNVITNMGSKKNKMTFNFFFFIAYPPFLIL